MSGLLYILILNRESLMPVKEDAEFKKSNERVQLLKS